MTTSRHLLLLLYDEEMTTYPSHLPAHVPSPLTSSSSSSPARTTRRSPISKFCTHLPVSKRGDVRPAFPLNLLRTSSNHPHSPWQSSSRPSSSNHHPSPWLSSSSSLPSSSPRRDTDPEDDTADADANADADADDTGGGIYYISQPTATIPYPVDAIYLYTPPAAIGPVAAIIAPYVLPPEKR